MDRDYLKAANYDRDDILKFIVLKIIIYSSNQWCLCFCTQAHSE